MFRPLALTDMGAAAQVHRVAIDHAMPWLTGLHTPDEDCWFNRERVFPTCGVWGRFFERNHRILTAGSSALRPSHCA